MKKVFLSLFTIMLVAVAATGATFALFSDEETSTGNTFTAGSLDLKVNDNNDPISYVFTAGDLLPGKSVNGGAVKLTNDGTTPARLTMKIVNPVSNENGVTEPEKDAGDEGGVEKDGNGYDKNGGNGELWDMVNMTIFHDVNGNGYRNVGDSFYFKQWLDASSWYSIPLNENLLGGMDIVLQPGESTYIGVNVGFNNIESSHVTDNGMKSNLGMTDDIEFDAIFGLEQVN